MLQLFGGDHGDGAADLLGRNRHTAGRNDHLRLGYDRRVLRFDRLTLCNARRSLCYDRAIFCTVDSLLRGHHSSVSKCKHCGERDAAEKSRPPSRCS